MQWFYVKNGCQNGPIDFNALKQLVQTGAVLPTDLVWREGMAQWLIASTVPELNPDINPQTVGAVDSTGASPVIPLGYQPPTSYQPFVDYEANRYKKMATTAMVLSLVGLLCFGIILGVLGIIFGSIALSGMKRTNNYDNRGQAVAAIAVGAVDIAFFLFFIMIRLR